MQSLTNEKINDNMGLTAEEAEARRLAQLRARLNSRELAEEFARMVVARVEAYVRDLEGNKGLPLHEMIVTAAERPLLKWAMGKCEGNQKKAAVLLGINRNTLHKKLVFHGFLKDSSF